MGSNWGTFPADSNKAQRKRRPRLIFRPAAIAAPAETAKM